MEKRNMETRSGRVLSNSTEGALVKKAKTSNVVPKIEEEASSGRVLSDSTEGVSVKKARTNNVVVPKVQEEEEMIVINNTSRAEKKLECRLAIKSLWDRTKVCSEKTDDLADLINTLKEDAGIVIDKANSVCYRISTHHSQEEPGASVGGFSAVEKKKVYKLPPTGLDPISLKERRLPRIQTTSPAIVVVCNSQGHICLIHLQNVLTQHQVEQRNQIKNIFFGKMTEGWCKSCGLSGFLNLGDILHTLRDKSAAQKGYFGRYFSEYNVGTVVPTFKGKGGTAKTHYLNRKNEEKSFQVGNHINRAIIQGRDKSLENNNYISEMVKVISACDGFVEFPFPEQNSSRSHLGKGKQYNKENCSIAINFDMHGQEAPLCIHDDKTVVAPCAVTAMKDPKHKVDLSSLHHHYNADAGELFHEIGGLVHGYNSRDIIIFNGKHYHSPMRPQPCPGGKKAGRFSFVVFLNKPGN